MVSLTNKEIGVKLLRVSGPPRLAPYQKVFLVELTVFY